MDKLKAQADKLWQLLANPATGEVYQKTLALTWSILKETGLLLWLVICLVLVLGDWFWKYSYQAGQNARIWVTDLQTKTTHVAETNAEPGDVLTTTGKSLLAATQASLKAALNTAKGQLGMEVLPEPPKPTFRPASTIADTPLEEVAIAEAPVLERPITNPPAEGMALPEPSETTSDVETPIVSTQPPTEDAPFDTEGLLNEPKVPGAESPES
ncbi:MAG: hypothetical protein IGS48_09790 [Oscillatoriales cyanobacterium C42_A2020_001]|nr:hypothetical protein [Leptolyngbyaceae cyanobacterium C42_A2020_001]